MFTQPTTLQVLHILVGFIYIEGQVTGGIECPSKKKKLAAKKKIKKKAS